MRERPDQAAREARLIARRAASGALATYRRARRETGHPYVSKVGVALDMDGAALFLFSTLAAHTQDLLADGRCSLLVEAPDHGVAANPATNPLECARATLVGRAAPIEDSSDLERARSRYLNRHPGAARYMDFGDFAFWRLVPERVHFVGGFGRAKWARGSVYATPPGDLSHKGDGILNGLNDGRQADLGRLAGGRAGPWRALELDPDGLWLAPALDQDQNEVPATGAPWRIDFPSPAPHAKGWRERLKRAMGAA